MRLEPLHSDFGVEVKDVSVLDVVSSDDACLSVREAFETHSVLLWRGQDVSPEVQAAFTRAFGPLEVTKFGESAGTIFGVLTNIGANGEIVPPTARQWMQGLANRLWHTDSSFKEIPALASALSAVVVPSTGGETEFASTRAAWDRIRPDEQLRIRALTAVHSFATSRSKISAEMTTEMEKKLYPPVRWKMTWDNPIHGRTALYLASHIGTVEEMDGREAHQLLEDLQERTTRPQYCYKHSWKPGDIVIWDNRATVHRGPPWGADAARKMVRTTASATSRDGLASVTPSARLKSPAPANQE